MPNLRSRSEGFSHFRHSSCSRQHQRVVVKTNDRKLFAYLKMGLSSKEMASLLNTSVRSIETARYRLRKKLYLEQGENLTDFIQMLDNENIF